MMNTQQVVTDYLRAFPEDKESLASLLKQLKTNDNLQGKTNFKGHVTAGSIVISPDRHKVLMIHHNIVNRWLQPGGHWDVGESDTLAAARREAVEETSVSIGQYVPFDASNPLVPIHIETHRYPERPAKNEPAHDHHDFRYVFIADLETLCHQVEEVHGAAWFDLDSPEAEELRPVLNRIKSLLQI